MNISQQKKYILENAQYLNKTVRLNLLSTVLMHLDEIEEIDKSKIVNSGSGGVHINLDKLDDIVLQQLYSIVFNRMSILNTKYIKGVTPL